MFPLPGAPRQQPMDASRLQAFMAQPSGGATNTALKPLNARQSKRLFVSNLPASATDENIIQFFNLQLNNLNVTSASDPCISAQISKDRSFALLEFKAPGDATVGLALDGIHMESNSLHAANGRSNGSSAGLTIRRPKDYIVPSVAEEGEESITTYKGGVPDTPDKISITNIPPILTDEQISELLITFGELKAFVLVKENGTEESRVSLCSITLSTKY
jgi:splicing factor U2AF subunit